MPVEPLWQWLRNEFQKFVNNQPYQVADRLWITTSLDLEVKRRRFST